VSVHVCLGFVLVHSDDQQRGVHGRRRRRVQMEELQMTPSGEPLASVRNVGHIDDTTFPMNVARVGNGDAKVPVAQYHIYRRHFVFRMSRHALPRNQTRSDGGRLREVFVGGKEAQRHSDIPELLYL